MSRKLTQFFMITGLFFVLNLFLPDFSALAAPPPAKKKVPVIMVGDRLVDAASSLGIIPSAMSVRCSMWPLCDTLKSTVQLLGCPSCLGKKKLGPLLKYGSKHGIKTVVIEKNNQFCEYLPNMRFEHIGNMLKTKGYKVIYVDFNNGLANALAHIADLFNVEDKVEEVLTAYKKAMKRTRDIIAKKKFVKNAVIINGIYQDETGKTFLRVEVPGGYSDKFLLNPLGVRNIGNLLVGKGKKALKGHVSVRKLKGLIKAAPEVIVMTGDTAAVQKALFKALKKNPELLKVPAIKSHAIFSLPAYIDSSVIEYPGILRKWADLLSL